MLYVVGGQALSFHMPSLPAGDLDLLGREAEFRKFLKSRENDIGEIVEAEDGTSIYAESKQFGFIECELIKPGSSGEDYERALQANPVGSQKIIVKGFELTVVSLAVLYSVRLSHIWHPINFKKHIRSFWHLDKHMSKKDIYPEITAKRKAEVALRLKVSDLPSFTAGNYEEIRMFLHEDIHRVFAVRGVKAYLKLSGRCLRDEFDKYNMQVWSELSFLNKMAFVIEEACVKAIEQLYTLPYIRDARPIEERDAECLENALTNIATVRTKLYDTNPIRQFARDNYFEILNEAKEYGNFFREAVKQKRIKRIPPIS